MTAFGADLDNVTEAFVVGVVERLRAMGVWFFLWETYSHKARPQPTEENPNPPDAPTGRYRVIIPFSSPLPIANAEQWSRGAWPRLMRHFGFDGDDAGKDKTWKDPCRLFYTPRHPEGETREAIVDGDPSKAFDAVAFLGELSRLVPAAALPVPRASSETEDPSRPVDLEALKAALQDTHNETTRALAGRVARGEALTPPPKDRKPGDLDRHNAWWLITGRLSIVAEEWM